MLVTYPAPPPLPLPQPHSHFHSTDCLARQVEERLRFYEEGVAPRKNVDVMLEAMAKVKDQLAGEAAGGGGDGADKKKVGELVHV